MEFYYIKAIHIVFVVTWFAELFYLPRLLVYAAEAQQLDNAAAREVLLQQYAVMKKRLLLGIGWPSAIITLAMGSRLLMLYPLTGWLQLKLVFVTLVFLYQFSLHYLVRQQAKSIFRYNGQQLRIWNEVPTILLVAIVFLVVLKNVLDFWWGLLGLAILIVLLLTAIRLYKRVRNAARK